MTMQMQRRIALTTRILLGAIAASLLLSTAWWLYALIASHQGNREPVEVAIPDVSSVRFDASGNYPAMLERPLFWPERKPAPPGETAEAASGEAAAAGPEGLVYLGVIVKGDVKQALLKDGDEVRVLHEGERIRGLAIRRIGVDGVTLAGNAGDVHLPAPVDNSATIDIRRTQ